VDITLVQYDIAWEDKPASHRLVEALLEASPPPAGGLVVLPEMSDTGFSFRLDRIVDERTRPWAGRLAARHRCLVLVGDAVPGPEGRGRNRVTLVRPDGTISGDYHKVFPFSFGRETEYFSGGDRLLLRDLGSLRLCPLICYDLRFPELFRLAASAGAGLFTVTANWPQPRTAHWRALLVARAIENQAFVIGVNRTGRDPHLAYAGGSIAVAPDGTVLAEAGTEPEVTHLRLDPEDLSRWRKAFPALGDLRPDLLGRIDRDGPAPA
jgi:predicted amidohydrolase